MNIVKRQNPNEENPIKRTIRRHFNAIGRAHIIAGHKVIPVYMQDKIVSMKVEEMKHTYAILQDPEGEPYGVDLND